MYSSTTEPIRRGRAVPRTCGTRNTARPARSRPIAVSCMLPSPRRLPADVPRAVSRDRDMHDAPIGARRRSRGLWRMLHLPDRPQPTAIASNGASRMIREPPRACDPPPPTSRCQPLKNPTAPRPPRNQRPPGTDARRTRHCGDGPLGILASPNGPAAIPSGGCRAPARPEIAVRPPTAPGPESGETCSPTDRGTRSRSRTGAPREPRRTRRRGSSAPRNRRRRRRW